ncbi:MAG: ATP-dependent acyl-CoA ligase, partial [Gemmatimonadales bacterium]|nr:ATP-dependent acyl-CoA ligase [Gemmatimonadales bacterium]
MALTERFQGFTVAAALANRATSDPSSVYLRYRDQVVSFGQVASRAEALAASLANLGVERGDRIAL